MVVVAGLFANLFFVSTKSIYTFNYPGEEGGIRCGKIANTYIPAHDELESSRMPGICEDPGDDYSGHLHVYLYRTRDCQDYLVRQPPLGNTSRGEGVV
jgi:hypothetical protein